MHDCKQYGKKAMAVPNSQPISGGTISKREDLRAEVELFELLPSCKVP